MGGSNAYAISQKRGQIVCEGHVGTLAQELEALLQTNGVQSLLETICWEFLQ